MKKMSENQATSTSAGAWYRCDYRGYWNGWDHWYCYRIG